MSITQRIRLLIEVFGLWKAKNINTINKDLRILYGVI